MKKLIILGLALLMVVVFGTVALAEADEQKLVPYVPHGPIHLGASGMAIVNYPEGDVALVITVSVKGLEPNTLYRVKAHPLVGGGWSLIGVFTTNKNGNGHFHINKRVGEELPFTGHIYINNEADDKTVLVDEDF